MAGVIWFLMNNHRMNGQLYYSLLTMLFNYRIVRAAPDASWAKAPAPIYPQKPE
jgi:hypothetical protein